MNYIRGFAANQINAENDLADGQSPGRMDRIFEMKEQFSNAKGEFKRRFDNPGQLIDELAYRKGQERY